MLLISLPCHCHLDTHLISIVALSAPGKWGTWAWACSKVLTNENWMNGCLGLSEANKSPNKFLQNRINEIKHRIRSSFSWWYHLYQIQDWAEMHWGEGPLVFGVLFYSLTLFLWWILTESLDVILIFIIKYSEEAQCLTMVKYTYCKN